MVKQDRLIEFGFTPVAGDAAGTAGLFAPLSKHSFGRENRTFEPLPLISLLEASPCFSLDALRVLSNKRE